MSSITTKGSDQDTGTVRYSDGEIATLLNQRDATALVGLSQRAAVLEAILTRQFRGFINSEDIRDIVADTLLDAMRKGDRYNAALASLLRWLVVLGHFNALQFLRKSELLANVTLDGIGNLKASQLEVHQPAVLQVPSAAIEGYIAQLPAQQARIIRWYFYDELSVEQIAELLNLELVSVRSTKSRALRKLRDLMGDASDV